MTDILSPEERRERNRQEVIDGILQAAIAVMEEDGVAALNLQKVAKKVGMRAPSLYTYFEGKDGIYQALFTRGMRTYRERNARSVEQYGVSWQAIEMGLRDFMQFADENPALYQLLFERPVPGFVPSEEGLREGQRLIEEGLAFARTAQATGIITTDISAEQASNFYIAVMHGLTALRMANEPDTPIGEGRFGSLIPLAIETLRKAWTA